MRSFETLEYLEISHCAKLETISFCKICGCMYLNVLLEDLPSLSTIEWNGSCFKGNEECRGWNQYKKIMMDGKSSGWSNRSFSAELPASKQRRVEPSLQESFRDAYLRLKRFGCKAVLGALVMNSECDEMNSF